MSNIKLKDHNWAAEGIYDTNQSKSQQAINSDVSTKIGQATLQTSSQNLSGATNELKGRADTLDSKYDNVVTVANTQPSSQYNKVWLPLTVNEGTQVPTWAEHQALESSLNGAITAHFPEDSITNLNDLPTGTIIGKFGNNTTNAPTTGSGTIWHYASSANSACQFVQSNGFLGIFARYRASGIWADWVRLDDISPNFVNELSVTIDNIEIAAENNADIDTSYEPYTSYTPTKAGYKAIAITGWTLTSASSGGTNPNNCTVFTYRMNSAGQLYFRIKNNATTAAKIRLRVYILWVKSST